MPRKCSNVKPVNNTLKTENKAELIDRFTQHIHQDHFSSKLKGSVLFNSSDLLCRVSSSELKALFTSNPKEADTKIVYCCSNFKPCIVEFKDTDVFLMIYL